MSPPLRQGLWLVVLIALCLASQAGLSPQDASNAALAESLALLGRVAVPVPPIPPEIPAPQIADPIASPPVGARRVDRPGAALLSVPFAWVGKLAGEKSAAGAEAEHGALSRQILLGASAAATATAALLVFLTAIEFGCSRAGAWAAALVFGLTTQAWPLGGRLHDAVFATPVLLGCLYGWLRVRSGYDSRASRLALGISLGLMPLVHDVTLLLLPVFLLLVLAQGKHLWRPRFRWVPLVGPFAVGLAVFAMYNASAFGGALIGSGGGDVVAEAWARRVSGPIWSQVRALLFGGGGWRALLSAATMPPAQPFAFRDLGVLVAAPQLVIGLLGYFPLRYEGMTRRPVFALVVIATLWTLLVGSGAAPVDRADALPLIALLCVLAGSFVDYHLMSMDGLLIKPLFWLAYLYFCALAAVNALAAIFARTLTAAPLTNLWDVYGKMPAAVPGMMDLRSFASLAFPGLPNLPVTLPAAAAAFLAPFALSFALRDRDAVWLGPSPQTLRKINTPPKAVSGRAHATADPKREPLATELRRGSARNEPEEPPVRVARPAPAPDADATGEDWRDVYGGGADAQHGRPDKDSD